MTAAYWMLGFENDVGKFFWFLFFMFLTLNVMAFYGVLQPPAMAGGFPVSILC